MKKLPQFKDAMRTLMLDASTTLEGLPAARTCGDGGHPVQLLGGKNARKEMPKRVFMSAEKQKLVAAGEPTRISGRVWPPSLKSRTARVSHG